MNNKEQRVLNLQEETKTFADSELVLKNRQNLSISGVEKIFEMTETNVTMRVAGSNVVVAGESLSVEKLDVETGNIQIVGKVNSITYSSGNVQRKNLFKRIFK